jgi:hypothetical protein
MISTQRSRARTQSFPYFKLRPGFPTLATLGVATKILKHDAITLFFFEKVPVVVRRRERTSCSGPRCEMGRDDVRESKPIQYAESRGPRFASRPGLRRLLCNSTRLAVKRCTRTQDDHWSHAPERGNWRGTMTTCNLPVPLSRSVTEVIIIVLASVIHLIILPSPPSRVRP